MVTAQVIWVPTRTAGSIIRPRPSRVFPATAASMTSLFEKYRPITVGVLAAHSTDARRNRKILDISTRTEVSPMHCRDQSCDIHSSDEAGAFMNVQVADPVGAQLTAPTPVPGTPAEILQVGFGFWGAKVLLSAVDLGVFTELAKGSLGADDLGDRVGVNPRGRRDFLDALVALGMLDRSEGLYSNTPTTNLFLDRAKPS